MHMAHTLANRYIWRHLKQVMKLKDSVTMLSLAPLEGIKYT